jgi:hypothetical protein
VGCPSTIQVKEWSHVRTKNLWAIFLHEHIASNFGVEELNKKQRECRASHVSAVLFYPENGGNKFLRIVGEHLLEYMASPLWDLHVRHLHKVVRNGEVLPVLMNRHMKTQVEIEV